jgi:hypothetical protein
VLPQSHVLLMEELDSYETLVCCYQTTRHHVPECSYLHVYDCENPLGRNLNLKTVTQNVARFECGDRFIKSIRMQMSKFAFVRRSACNSNKNLNNVSRSNFPINLACICKEKEKLKVKHKNNQNRDMS